MFTLLGEIPFQAGEPDPEATVAALLGSRINVETSAARRAGVVVEAVADPAARKYRLRIEVAGEVDTLWKTSGDPSGDLS